MPASSSITRKAVLASAIRAFARKGYAGTSVQDVLRATRLSKPVLYYHFGSKEGLFRSILASAHDGAYELTRLRLDGAATCPDRLAAIGGALFDFASRHQHLMRLVFATTFAAPEEIPSSLFRTMRRRRIFQLVARVIRDCQRQGSLTRRHTVAELTVGFFGAVSHQIRTWLIDRRLPLTPTRARRLVALFLHGASGAQIRR